MYVYNFLQDFGKRKHCLYEHPVEFSSEKLMRYREPCIDAQNPSRISVTLCYFETRTILKTTLENGEFGMIDACAA
jgi:hypothetical protein